jgi:predicted RNA methylase
MQDQYFTRSVLAQRIVTWAGIERGFRVCEPSAGDGALALPILALPDVRVTAVELDPKQIRKLNAALASDSEMQARCKVVRGDFLKFKVQPDKRMPFDLFVMNPPYGSRKLGTVGLAARHVAHALLFAPRVVALVAAAFEFGIKNETNLFKDAWIKRRVVLVRRPEFDGPSDKGEGARRDYVVLELVRKENRGAFAPTVSTERWLIDEDRKTRRRNQV